MDKGNMEEHSAKPRAFGWKVWQVFRRHILIISTVTAAVLGFGFGFAIRHARLSQNALIWIGLPGELYMRMLKMMVVPLVISSIISGTTSLDPKSNGKVSAVGFTYIFITNTIGALIGLAGGLIARPGRDGNLAPSEFEQPTSQLETQDILVDLIRNLFPDNLFEATFRKSQTMTKPLDKTNSTNTTVERDVTAEVKKYVAPVDGTNLLGLIVACTLFGMALTALAERGRPLVDFCVCVYDTTIVIVRWLMWSTSIGVFSLIGVAIARIENIETVFSQLGMFVLTVTLCIAFQQAVVYTLILLLVTRSNPLTFYASMMKPWLIAFATAATAVAMPEMIVACEVTHNMNKGITRFIIPLAVSVSSNGSAVFIACASLFCCNISGYPPSTADVIQIGLLTSVASMAIPSVPSASIVTLIMILTSMNIPVHAIALLLAVEWFLDRLRTTSSVLSNCVGVAVTEKVCQNIIQKAQHDDTMVDEKADEKLRKYNVHNAGDSCELRPLHEDKSSTVS